MKVLLILPKIESDCQWNVGLAYISAILKENGHKTELFEMSDYLRELPLLFDKLHQWKPLIVGISANSHQFPYAKMLVADIKKNFNTPIFIGGVQAILKPKIIEDIKGLDGVCVGEGELAFLNLINKIESGQNYFDVKNFWFRDKDGHIIQNELDTLIENLDIFPYPDRSIFKYFQEKRKKVVPRFIFSRGCPFECSYCCNHAFKKKYAGLGKYVRWRSVDKALEEIRLERDTHNFDHFKLDDDTFSLNKDWMREFCEKIAMKRWGLTFECNVRPGTIDEEGMKILKEGGCVMVKIGIESGDENLRKNILNRHFLNEDIVKIFAMARRFGIKTFSFNMIGAPGETRETIMETINLNRKIKPNFMQITAFYPYPDTILGEQCLKNGYIEKEYEDSYMEKSILRLPTISRREIEKSIKNFKFKVYWGYNKKKALFEKWFQIKLFIVKQPVLHYLAKKFYKPLKFFKK